LFLNVDAYISGMPEDDVLVQIQGLLPTPGGSGVFLQAEGKAITIFIDPMVTRALQLALAGKEAPRPLTHDLLVAIQSGLGVKLLRARIHDCREETFFASLLLQQENELGKCLLEVDARPSDAMVLAVKCGAPLYVNRALWERTEDMSWAMGSLE
jgi:uncharacterized protein